MPDYQEKPYDNTIVLGTFAAIDADMQGAYNNVLNVYADIGTTSAPGALRQNEGSAAGVVALARGFSSLNDGGGGHFIWVIGSTTDDGFTKIVPQGTPAGYWQRLFDGATYRCKWGGMSSISANNAGILNSLIGFIGSENATIVIQQDEGVVNTDYDISGNVTVPSNIRVVFEQGARFDVAATFTVTFNGEVIASPKQIFLGNGDVAFGGGVGWTNWWPAINTALNSGLDYVKTLAGTYDETTTIVVPSEVRWEGIRSSSYVADNGVIIRPTSAVSIGIQTDASHYVQVRNLTVNMDNMSDALIVGPATTISFATAYDGGTISDSGSGLGSFAEGQTIGVTGSTSNDGSYVIQTVSAGSLVVKGPTMTTESAGASITLNAGAIGIWVKGLKRSIWEDVKSIITTGRHGIAMWHVTPQSSSGFSTYYNKFHRCGAKTGGSVKRGIGICCSVIVGFTVTMNTWDTCEVQACGTDWLCAGTASGFMVLNCNGESAGDYGIYVTDVASSIAPAVKVLGGEWNSADAGETGALIMWNTTINGTTGSNVTEQNFGLFFNDHVRADYFVWEERLYNYADNATISPDSAVMRISGTSAPITLNTTTPISAGERGQFLMLVGDDPTNIVTLENSGNVYLSQGIWYGLQNNILLLQYSQTASQWIEVSRVDANPIVVRTKKNAFYRFRQDEIELTLSGATTSWTSIIPVGSRVIGVTTRITEAITGASGYQVGHSGDVDAWGDITATIVGTTTDMADFTDTTYSIFQTGPNDVIITAKTSNFTGGKLRVSIFYEDLKAATG
jgi:hypothetical protein